MCTGLFIIDENGNCYQSRTLEFEAVLPYQPVVTDTIMGSTLDGTVFIDGINSNGLCVMGFYFKCSYSYNENIVDNKINLASYEVCGYFLNNATSVENAMNLAKNINVTQKPYGEPFNGVIPLHWFISDNKGNSIIVETNNGELIIYDNSKYKVCTNNPTYPEQVEKLEVLLKSNNFTYTNPQDDLYCGLGKGLIGMPGDYSSVSRFQRAYILSQGMIIPSYNNSNIGTIFHFNNNFDIVYGTVRDSTTTPESIDFTQYTAVYDLTNLKAYYKTYKDQSITLLGTLYPSINFYYYNISNILTFTNKYVSDQSGIGGPSVNSTVNITTLYNNFNIDVGKIQFNIVNIVSITYPSLYNVSEEIIIQLNNGSSIFALNQYTSSDGSYIDGEKYIIKIVSCTGYNIDKYGFIVIDVLGDKRNITIKLE
jgi:choloylglycine hydrolase